MDWSAIGKIIRQQREYMGLTREQFAEQIDVTPKFCSDIETGAKGMSVPALQKGLHLLRGGREFQRFAHKPPLVVFAEVGNVGFKQG